MLECLELANYVKIQYYFLLFFCGILDLPSFCTYYLLW